MMVEVDWSKLGFIRASKYRKEIIKLLETHPLTPTEITEKSNLHQSHISTTLSELKEENLVKCLNPEATKGRLYSLTKEGEKILKKLKDVNSN